MIGLDDWLRTPPGRHALAWEQAQYNALVADIFGYHALQLNLAPDLPAIDALSANRMPHRWRAALAMPDTRTPDDAAESGVSSAPVALGDSLEAARAAVAPSRPAPVALVADPAALPFAEASLDLIALPHTLEYCADPAAALREVARVLVHEGRLAVSGFNPASLWSLSGALPGDGDPIGPRHLRTLLEGAELELHTVRHGGHGLAPRHERAGPLARLSERLWPARGALWCAIAIKRSPGPKLVGQSWKTQLAPTNAQPGVAQRTEPVVD